VCYDGLEQATEMIRLEAFMHQCRERLEGRTRKAGPAAPHAAVPAAR